MIPTRYMENLVHNEKQIRRNIESLLQEFSVVPAGTGFIDLIVSRDKAIALVDRLRQINVAVSAISFWCHYIETSPLAEGCPHGYGGPVNPYGAGWFSECVQYPDYSVDEHGVDLDSSTDSVESFVNKCSERIIGYLESGLAAEPFYSPCLTPGLWLHVPDSWQRKEYRV